jgi:catechol 2,3-dioxygenase-like lactoylglutathione lyase family enzyme
MGTSLSVEALTLFVEDLARARDFYERAFGAPVVHTDADSVVFGFGAVVVNLLASTAAPQLVEPRSVGRPDDGPRVLITVPVEDVDRFVENLAEQGVELLNGPVDRPWSLRTAAFADPDGHVWEVAHPLKG